VSVDEVAPLRIAQPDGVGHVSAPSPAGWHFVRLTDTPIQIIAIYLFMTLVLPALLLADTDLWPDFYRYEDFSVIEGMVVIGAIVLACTLRHFQWTHKDVAIRQRPIFFYSMQKLRIAVLLVAIAVGIINFADSGFRYDDIGLSERGSISIYFFSLIPAFVKLLVIYHAFIYRGTSAMDRFERALVTTALVASINGNATAFMAVFSFGVLQTNARAYLFRSTFGAASSLRAFALFGIGIAVVAVVATILAGAYVYGESVKRQQPVDMVLSSLSYASLPEVAINRLSPTYVSLVNTLPLTFDFDRDSFANLQGVWNTLLFRLEALGLFDFGLNRQSATSIMRLNVDFISAIALTEREGTAPGLIPGFLYCFPPILNVLMLGAYVFMALGILQRLCLCMNEEMSFIGKFILTNYAVTLFESPVDLLLIIDDGFLFVAGLWWMSRLVEVAQPTLLSARDT
jgi:hypothetical protein